MRMSQWFRGDNECEDGAWTGRVAEQWRERFPTVGHTREVSITWPGGDSFTFNESGRSYSDGDPGSEDNWCHCGCTRRGTKGRMKRFRIHMKLRSQRAMTKIQNIFK